VLCYWLCWQFCWILLLLLLLFYTCSAATKEDKYEIFACAWVESWSLLLAATPGRDRQGAWGW
jgi:hypothetical protein